MSSSSRTSRAFWPSSDPFVDDDEDLSDDCQEQEKIERQRVLLREQLRLQYERVRDSCRAALTIKNILNAIFVLNISLICIFQCYTQISEYMKYSTRIQVTHSYPNSTLWLLPGVTVCNNNRLKMSKLMARMPDLKEQVQNVSSSINRVNFAFISRRKRTDFFLSIKELLDKSVNVTDITYNSRLADLMDLSRSRLITDINCNLAWGKPYNCENFRIIESYQGSPCYTMFFYGSILEAMSTGKAYDFNSSLIGGKRKVDSFNSYEMAEILVDFEPLDHADYQRDAGAKVMIHPRRQVGAIGESVYSLSPGNQYDLIIRRQTTDRLPPPYTSMCHDYDAESSKEFTEKVGSPGSVEFDTSNCVKNCITREVTRECNCWPHEVPYFSGDHSIVNNSDQYAPCPWGFDDKESRLSSSLYANCYKRFYEECLKVCPPGCKVEEYKVHVMATPWPTKETFFRAIGETQKRELQILKGCCARISIKYIQYMETNHKMYPSVTLVELVSNIGGIVSAMVGVSIVTVYRYLTRNILGCKVVNDKALEILKPPPRVQRRLVVAARRRALTSRICKQLARVSPMEE